jgi:hypothetical protein
MGTVHLQGRLDPRSLARALNPGKKGTHGRPERHQRSRPTTEAAFYRENTFRLGRAAPYKRGRRATRHRALAPNALDTIS